MTFQIGLFCREGMVLAGDTKSTEFGDQMHLSDHGLVRWSTTTSKFLYDEELRTVVAISGGPLFSVAARALLKDWDTAYAPDRVNIAEAPFKKSNTEERGGLIVVRPLERKMFRFILGAGTSMTEHTCDKIIQGDCATTAVLFVERYADFKLCSISKLKEIAALVVWMSGQISSYISGLEMVEFKDGELPHLLTTDECTYLEKKAIKMDSRIRNMLIHEII